MHIQMQYKIIADQWSMNPELLNAENFVGALCPSKFESEKTSCANAFRKQFEWICTIVCSTN